MSSANLDLARSIFACWGRGDFSSAEWAHQDVELVAADGPSPGAWTGRGEMGAGMRDLLIAWKGLRIEARGFRELDDCRVLVLARFSGRGKTSGLDLGHMHHQGAGVFEFREGKVSRYTYWLDAQRALDDLGLASDACETGETA